MLRRLVLISGLSLLPLLPFTAAAHGFAGQRFFPATLATDDAFVADELDFLGGYAESDDGTGTTAYRSFLSGEFAKRLSRDWQVSVANEYDQLSTTGAPRQHGWNNFQVGTKYQVFIDAAGESALALGFNAELGNTGSRAIADSASSYGPALYYAKGLGNLTAAWARPLAFTFVAQPTFSTAAGAPRTLQWGMSLQYSLPYLEDFVHATGMGEPFRSLLPLVEIPLSTCLDRCGPGARTTGSLNPGMVWVGKKSQLGFELVVPLNHDSGKGLGVLLQYHLYLDDIFPNWR